MGRVNEFMAVEGEVAEFAVLKNIAGIHLWWWSISDIKIPYKILFGVKEHQIHGEFNNKILKTQQMLIYWN